MLVAGSQAGGLVPTFMPKGDTNFWFQMNEDKNVFFFHSSYAALL